MNGWKAKLGSAFIAVIGALAIMEGVADVGWVGLLDLLTPQVVFGLVLIAWRAWVGEGQLRLPKAVKKGRLP